MSHEYIAALTPKNETALESRDTAGTRGSLGHADISTPLNTYSHVTPMMQERPAQVMEDVLGVGRP